MKARQRVRSINFMRRNNRENKCETRTKETQRKLRYVLTQIDQIKREKARPF